MPQVNHNLKSALSHSGPYTRCNSKKRNELIYEPQKVDKQASQKEAGRTATIAVITEKHRESQKHHQASLIITAIVTANTSTVLTLTPDSSVLPVLTLCRIEASRISPTHHRVPHRVPNSAKPCVCSKTDRVGSNLSVTQISHLFMRGFIASNAR